MSEKRFELDVRMDMPKLLIDTATNKRYNLLLVNDIVDIVDLLNEQEQKIQRWKKLYEIKDAEVTARVDALNKVCEYYTSKVLFKSDVDPNKAVKEVINAILNTEVEK